MQIAQKAQYPTHKAVTFKKSKYNAFRDKIYAFRE